MRRKQFLARVWAKLVAFEKTNRLLSPGDHILAAISGGPDSVCLAHYLWSMSRKKGFELSLVHFHHGLRGKAADGDAKFVKKLGADLNLPTRAVRIAVAKTAKERGKGLEDAGRYLRYAALQKEAGRLGCNKIATGHQLDDQAETVLLNLSRGNRLSALAGIMPQRPMAKGLALIRPLLALSRPEVLAYLQVHHLKHRLDRSNLSTQFTRNWLRLKIIPALEKRNPQIREHLSLIASQIQALHLNAPNDFK